METKFIFVLMGDESIKGFGQSPENTFQEACCAQEINCEFRMQTFSQMEPYTLRGIELPLEMRR